MSDPGTIRFYDEQTEAYKKVAEGFSNRLLAQMIGRLPRGARVLDLGCGPGQDTRQMLQSGLAVTAMDASTEMIRQVALMDGAETRLATFDTLDDVAVFDAVWASFSLLHAPKSEFPGHLAAIYRALKPGGLLVLSMKVGDGEARDRLNRFYAYYQPRELRTLLENAGFRIEGLEHGRTRGMAGTDDPFVTVTALA